MNLMERYNQPLRGRIGLPPPPKYNTAYLIAAIAADLFLLAMQIYACAQFTGVQISDASSYWAFAQYNADNNTWYPNDYMHFSRYAAANGYINILSLFLRISRDLPWIGILNILFTQTIVFSSASIAWQLTGRRQSACLSVVLLSLMGGLWGEAAIARTELCFIAFSMLSLALMLRRKTGSLALSGVLLAIANWVRPLLVVYLPAVVLYLLLKKTSLRKIAVYVLSAALVCGGIGLSAYLRMGDFIYQANTMGANMLLGSNDRADGSFEDSVYEEGGLGYLSPEEMRGMSYRDYDAYYTEKAVGWIFTHPVRFLSLIPAKLFYFLATDTYGGAPFFDNVIETDNLAYLLSLRDILLGRGERPLALGDIVVIESQLMYMVVFALYLLNIVSSIRRRYIGDTLFMHAIFALNCGVVALTVGAARYHMPLLPIFCILAAIELDARETKAIKAK